MPCYLSDDERMERRLLEINKDKKYIKEKAFFTFPATIQIIPVQVY